MDDDIKQLNIVVPAAWAKKIDAWRRRQPDVPNLSEAIRRLVELGLANRAASVSADRFQLIALLRPNVTTVQT